MYVSICPQDGLVFLNPRWSKADYNHFYAQEYDQWFRPEEFHRDVTDEVKYGRIRTVWKRLAMYPQPIHSVLDIGCGKGHSLEYIAKERPGVVSAGIEMSSDAIAHLRNGVGAEVLSTDVDADWHIGHAGRFDLVILRHVLEHFLDPVAALTKIRSVLSANGRIYIAVPDTMHPNRSLDSEFRVVHTYFFNETTLASVASRAGLVPAAIRSEQSEVWGLFTAAPQAAASMGPSTYQQQIKVIHALRRREFLKDVLAYLPRRLPKSLRNLVPDRLKAWAR